MNRDINSSTTTVNHHVPCAYRSTVTHILVLVAAVVVGQKQYNSMQSKPYPEFYLRGVFPLVLSVPFIPFLFPPFLPFPLSFPRLQLRDLEECCQLPPWRELHFSQQTRFLGSRAEFRVGPMGPRAPGLPPKGASHQTLQFLFRPRPPTS